MIIYTCYSALLTATMTSRPGYVKLHDFNDIQMKGYQTLLLSGTVLDSWFLGFLNNSAASQLYHSTIKNNPNAYFASLETLKDELLASSLALTFSLESSFTSDSRFRIVPEFQTVAKLFCSFVLQRDSELTELFSHHLKGIKESGVEELTERRLFEAVGSLENGNDQAATAALGFDNISFPFVGLASAIVAAVVVVTIEVLLFRSRESKR